MADVQTDDLTALRKDVSDIRGVLTFIGFFVMVQTGLVAAWLFEIIEVGN